jgi:nitroreductase
METSPGFFDVVYNTGSMRRLRPDPVPEEILVKLIGAGIRGPNAANAQNWRFIVVQDRQVMRRLAEPWRRGIGFFVGNAAGAPPRPGKTSTSGAAHWKRSCIKSIRMEHGNGGTHFQPGLAAGEPRWSTSAGRTERISSALRYLP